MDSFTTTVMSCINPIQKPLSSKRRTANYHRNIWHDNYIQQLQIDVQEAKKEDEIEKLVAHIKCQLMDAKDTVEKVENIDALQQLGLAYHFEKEINIVLSTIFSSVENISSSINNDLHMTSLLFRLLREDGFNISSNIFDSFKEDRGTHDIQGMLSLYEASYHAKEGENVLDKARIRAKEYLNEALKSFDVDPLVKEHVKYELDIPLLWRMQRVHHRWFIDQYEKKANKTPMLLRLAKLDFNYVQRIHKSELKEFSRWWVNLGIGEKLDFFRDRTMENYLGALCGAFEPKSWRTRKVMAEAYCFITLIDDMYDVYGTLEELELFTDVVVRWDVNAIGKLPDYMRICFLSLFNTMNNAVYNMQRTKGMNILPQIKIAWADLCKAYLVEAKWYHNGYTPTFQEYIENGRISIGAIVFLTLVYCTSEDITEELLEKYEFYPDVVRDSLLIMRLCNDLGTSTAELRRGDVPKAIQCYMYENNVTESIAIEKIKDIISSTWRNLNGKWTSNSSVEKSLKSVALNIQRITYCVYRNGDEYAAPGKETKDNIVSQLIKPIPL